MNILHSTSIIFLLIGLAIGASAVNYECSFQYREKWFADHKKFYDCEVIGGSIDKYEQRFVKGVTGVHRAGHSDSKVESLSILQSNHVHMPHKMDEYFENIVCLDVFRVGLTHIHHEDLQQYPNLKYLSLNENKLKNLDRYLFQYNPELEVIVLYKNQIQFVNQAFYELENLRSLDFTENRCHTGEVKNSVSQTKNLVQQIYNRCKM